MIHNKALIAIREAHGLSQEALADKLGYTVDYIRALEDKSKNRETATPEFLNILREKLDLHDAPLTEEELKQHTEELHRWRDLIDYGEMRKAAVIRPKLAKRTKLSFRQGTQCLYDLYEVRYYRAVGDKKAYEKLMASLSERKHAFNERCNYLYYRQEAMAALDAYRFKDAHAAFCKAEEIDKESKWLDVGFYYAYGTCLSYMGYATRSIEYCNMALHKARWSMNHEANTNRRYDLYIECILAQNHSKVGNTEEALFILTGRLRYEIERSRTSTLGFVYHFFGQVYQQMGELSKALENYDNALKYHHDGSVFCKDSLYHKAESLIACDRICEAVQCIEKGLTISSDEVWKSLFDALKHSVSLSCPKSLEYMKNTAIPRLLELELYEEAMTHHETLSRFYEKIGNDKLRAEHSDSALAIQKQLYRERVERGL